MPVPSSSRRVGVQALVLLALASSTAFYGSPAVAEKPAPPPRAPADKSGKDKTPAVCTQVTGSVISEAYGYKHVVSVRNGCDKPVECQVWTDVDPTRNVVQANPGETVQVITRIGSPASEFKALKECRFR